MIPFTVSNTCSALCLSVSQWSLLRLFPAKLRHSLNPAQAHLAFLSQDILNFLVPSPLALFTWFLSMSSSSQLNVQLLGKWHCYSQGSVSSGRAQVESQPGRRGVDPVSMANSRRLERQAVGIGHIQLQILRISHWIWTQARFLFLWKLGIKQSSWTWIMGPEYTCWYWETGTGLVLENKIRTIM